jgi:hypothetical protein
MPNQTQVKADQTALVALESTMPQTSRRYRETYDSTRTLVQTWLRLEKVEKVSTSEASDVLQRYRVVVRIGKHSYRLGNPKKSGRSPKFQTVQGGSYWRNHQSSVERSVEQLFTIPAPTRETSSAAGNSPPSAI